MIVFLMKKIKIRRFQSNVLRTVLSGSKYIYRAIIISRKLSIIGAK